ncbi:MAG TPA: beta-phosphoglucomutase family hydrolase [Anaeromyxobacter sp.]|nr:beta-phosphoglucomutase family hydrolase [Anaeromyxobacter sp.]
MQRPLAAIFDLDGTLVDNMAFHGEAWVAMARRLGSRATRRQFEQEWAGKKSAEIFAILLGHDAAPEEANRLAEEKEVAYRALYAPRVAALPGLLAFLGRLEEAGVRLAVATAAPRANRELVLGRLGLERRFERVVGPEEVSRGKPAPDLFLAAAQGLGVEPTRCLAFEDAANGVVAARAAGMEAAGVLTTSSPEALRAAGARWLLYDYAALPADLEAVLFGAAPG